MATWSAKANNQPPWLIVVDTPARLQSKETGRLRFPQRVTGLGCREYGIANSKERSVSLTSPACLAGFDSLISGKRVRLFHATGHASWSELNVLAA